MDRTLTTSKRGNKQRQARNWKAWQEFSREGSICKYCPHDHTQHLCTSSQPRIYTPWLGPPHHSTYRKPYLHELEDGRSFRVYKTVIAKKPEFVTVFCKACARELGASQVLCYQRNVAIGETVGLRPDEEGESS